MRLEVREHVVEVLLALLAVAVPPHGVLGELIDLGVLVLRRAAGVMAGLGAERAARDDRRFAVADRVLIERRLDEVPVNLLEILQAELVGAKSCVTQTGLFHGNPPHAPGCLRLPKSSGTAFAAANDTEKLSP